MNKFKTMFLDCFSGLKKQFCKKKEKRNFEEIEKKLGYNFTNDSLLIEALTHKSYANEMQNENSFGNERLEFLGDAVLELVISHILMERCKSSPEGKLSNMRAAIVNKHILSSVAINLDLNKYILLSRGEEENKGRNKKSILANVYEAIIAAVYYDGGYREVFCMLEKHFSELINEVTQKGFFWDYKSRLQEYSQEKFVSVPRYIVLAETGPDHKKTYDIQVLINDIPYENGRGRNKKAAEQEAAKRTLEKLLKQAP